MAQKKKKSSLLKVVTHVILVFSIMSQNMSKLVACDPPPPPRPDMLCVCTCVYMAPRTAAVFTRKFPDFAATIDRRRVQGERLQKPNTFSKENGRAHTHT
jgi:hypothetical protein